MALYREPDYGFESDGNDSYDYNDDGPVDVWDDSYNYNDDGTADPWEDNDYYYYYPNKSEWFDCSADDRNLAVIMALHSRLGADSPLAELGHLLVDLAHLWMA